MKTTLLSLIFLSVLGFSQTKTITIDVKNTTSAASSWIRNPANAGGQQDYVHLTNTGQDEAGQLAYDTVVDSSYTKIVCVGTSITYGVGATGWPVYLSQKLNN